MMHQTMGQRLHQLTTIHLPPQRVQQIEHPRIQTQTLSPCAKCWSREGCNSLSSTTFSFALQRCVMWSFCLSSIPHPSKLVDLAWTRIKLVWPWVFGASLMPLSKSTLLEKLSGSTEELRYTSLHTSRTLWVSWHSLSRLILQGVMEALELDHA